MFKIKDFVKKNYKLLILAFGVAILGHLYFIKNQFLGNAYMVGPGDQSAQMIIFKEFLYDQFKNGNFFYSFAYNGGGNFFTRLSYYYSTSIVFYITVIVTMLLEALNIIAEPDLFYWVESMLFISILRSTVIIFITTRFIEMFNVKRVFALFGASIYAVSVVYFRHTALWEMFSDAMIWLPILLIGIEKIIRGYKGNVFSIGVFLTLFNNGAFAFINLLFTGAYALLRMLFKLTINEIDWKNQLKKYISYGLIGLGLSLPGFIPFVLGFFQTSRLTSEVNVALTNFNLSHLVNHLYIDPVFVVPFLFIFMCLMPSNYKNKKFTFFAVFSVILILLRFNPAFASLTNGFGHPQYRWLYITNLLIGIVVSLGIQEMVNANNIERLLKNTIIASSIVIILYSFVEYRFLNGDDSLIVNLMPYLIASQIILLLVLSLKTNKITRVFFILGSLSLYLVTIYTSNQQLSYQYDLFARDKEYYINDKNREEDFKEVVKIIENETDNFYRVDFDERLNFGLVYNVSTFNNYSSFQNKHQQYFNRYFQIDTKIDSNGVVEGLAGRQNLNSLFKVDFIILDDSYDYRLPNNYSLIDSYKDYAIYKNNLPLTFIHPVKELYSYQDLDTSAFKDELVVKGAIVPDEFKNTSIDNNEKLIEKLNYDIEFKDVKYDGNIISVTGKSPEIRLNFSNISNQTDAVVIEYTLIPLEKFGQYRYIINDYPFELAGYQDQYSSQIFTNEIHLSPADEVNIKFHTGSDYVFEIHSVHEINNQELEKRHVLDSTLEYNLTINEGKIDILFNNIQEFPFIVLPVFNEQGWQLTINDEPAEIINTNMGMIGFEIPNGEVKISLYFTQPFFRISLVIATISLLLLIFIDDERLRVKWINKK